MVEALSPEVVRAVSEVVGSPDVVFDALDGRDCTTDGGTCHVEIYGIHDAGGHRWMQLGLNGQMLTLRADGCDADWALVSLASAAA